MGIPQNPLGAISAHRFRSTRQIWPAQSRISVAELILVLQPVIVSRVGGNMMMMMMMKANLDSYDI